MKSEKIQNAIGMIDGELVTRTENYVKKSKRKHIKWIVPVAAALVIVILSGIVFSNNWLSLNNNSFVSQKPASVPMTYAEYTGPEPITSPINNSPEYSHAYCLSAPVYPERVQYPITDDGVIYGGEEYDLWIEADDKRREYFGAGKNLDSFFSGTISEFLKDSDKENTIYSPLNVYFALAMIAETTEGDTRQQILDLLCAKDIESLRTQAGAIWNANYQEDGLVTSRLANSLWLNDDISYDEETINNLVSYYFASVFQGKMGSKDYNEVLQDWINEQTSDFLKDQVSDFGFSPENIMSLVSTIYFKDQWTNAFSKNGTTEEIFHTPQGDKKVDFMHDTVLSMPYFWGENFTSIFKSFNGSGGMYFIRPDDDVDVDKLIYDKEMLSFIMIDDIYSWEKQTTAKVNMSIPKFDVASDLDLKEGLKKLGITDCFESTEGGFSVLEKTTDNSAVYISDIKHSARVKIDEEGVEAAAVTIGVFGAGAPNIDKEVDFVLDKPFIFVIVNDDGLPLFVGVVNNP